MSEGLYVPVTAAPVKAMQFTRENWQEFAKFVRFPQDGIDRFIANAETPTKLCMHIQKTNWVFHVGEWALKAYDGRIVSVLSDVTFKRTYQPAP